VRTVFNERFLGQPGKPRATAGAWREAAKILELDYWDSETAWREAAKYVNKPNRRCYRSLGELRENPASGKKDFLYRSDRDELQKYAAALNDPRDTEMRGVETVTNNQDSVRYWRVMMAAYGVKGAARYVP
jgi:hypothetical protein